MCAHALPLLRRASDKLIDKEAVRARVKRRFTGVFVDAEQEFQLTDAAFTKKVANALDKCGDDVHNFLTLM